LPKCYPNTGGRIYLDGCFGRYANYSFFSDALDSYDTKMCNSTVGNSTDHNFYKTVQETFNNVTVTAKRKNGFAVGSTKGFNTSVYALVQCWEVLNQSACNSCLDAATSSVLECVPALEGRALFAGCYIRYSNKIFWNVDYTGSSSSGIIH
jgi:Salt stress response/antifungal